MLTLACLLWFGTIACAGTSFSILSDVTTVIAIKNRQEMERIYIQIIEAKAASQRILSKAELEIIKALADEVFRDQAHSIVDSGATVYCGSQVME